MIELYLIEIKDASKEVWGGDFETTFEERFECRKFFGLLERTLVIQGISPSDQMLLDKSFRFQGLNLPCDEFGQLPEASRDQLYFFDLLLPLFCSAAPPLWELLSLAILSGEWTIFAREGGLWIKVLIERIWLHLLTLDFNGTCSNVLSACGFRGKRTAYIDLGQKRFGF